ncbi:MAG: Ig-like domain-containing protein [Paludibacteraceae bacterium]|nr:Ig-like domain-containing protein [Paludibacteraceae bacterium]
MKKHFLFLALAALCSLSVMGETAEWGYPSYESFATNKIGCVTLTTGGTVGATPQVVCQGGAIYANALMVQEANKYLDISLDEGATLKEIEVSIVCVSDASWALTQATPKIAFCSSATYDASKIVSTADLGRNVFTAEQIKSKPTIPATAQMARIYYSAWQSQHYIYYLKVTAESAAPAGPTHQVKYEAGGATGSVPATKDVEETKTYKLAEPTNLSYTKHTFAGWKSSADDNIYPAGTPMTMGTADVTYTAQWEAQTVPMVTNLQIVGAENNVVPLSFVIPGIVDLSKPVTPLASSTGDPTYTYNSETDVATAKGTAKMWEQYGMAFNIGSVSNIETVSFEYMGQEHWDISLWAGACDASYAYWEKDVTHTISTSFQAASVRPNQKYWAEGSVDNPLTFAVPQVAIYANAGNGTYANQTFSVRNVRYHVKDAIDVDHIVITRRLSTESVDAAVQLYSGTKSAFTDNTITAAGTYVYAVYCYDADGNASNAATIDYVYAPVTTYAVAYLAGAEDVTGDLPTEPEHIEGGKFSVAAATGLKRLGYSFAGWNDGTTTYQPNAEYTMPAAPVEFTAQWEAVVVPTISNLQIKNAEDNIVPLIWNIPGICDLSNPVAPLVQSSGNPTYSYDAATNIVTTTGTSIEYNQCGIAFNIGSVTNLESISYTCTGTVNSNVNLWAGVCDASYAYWQSGQTVHPTATEQNVSYKPNTKYWSEGSVTNPLSFAVSQVAIYANSGAGTHDNQVFSVSNVRYHVKDAIEIEEVVVMMKEDAPSTSLTDGTEIYRGTNSKYTDNSTKTVNKTYYYTVFALDADGVPSAGVSISYTYVVKEPHAVTYLAGAEDVTGDLPTAGSYKESFEFNLPEAGNLARDGYTFNGWNDGTTTYIAGAEYTMPNEAVEFTAQWKELPTIPNTLDLDDAVLVGEEWTRDGEWIKRGDKDLAAGTVTWTVNATKAGDYNVSVKVSCDDTGSLTVTVYDSNQQSLGSVGIPESWQPSGVKDLGLVTIPAQGTYTVVVTCTTAWAHVWFNTLKLESVKSTPTASFATASKELYPEETFTQTVTTNSDGDVTYSSNNTGVATVDPATGEVTAVAKGLATITATIAETADYKSTTATYTINVLKASGPIYLDPGTDKLKAIMNDLEDGDVIVFRDGAFTETTNLSFSKAVTLRADEDASPVLNCTYFQVTKGITVDGLTINSTTSEPLFRISGTGADMIFRNCTMHNNAYCFYQQGTIANFVMDNCVITSNSSIAVQLSQPATNISITNSTFINNGSNSLYLNGSTTSVLIDHCTFYNNTTTTYTILATGTQTTISNCVLYTTTAGVHAYAIWGNGSAPVVKNCIINNWTYKTTNTTNANLWTDDPLIYVENGDYFYQNGSPIVGKATDGSNLGDPRWHAPIVIIDETATEKTVLTENLDKTVNVQLVRSLNGGMFNTFCLPFDLSADQIAASDLAGAQIIELTSTSFEEGKLFLNFEEVEAIEAGVAYLIAPVADVENPAFEGVTITMDEAPEVVVGDVDVRPSFIVTNIAASPANLFLYQDNTLYYAGEDTEMNGMRAYFHVHNEMGLIPARMRIGRRTPTDDQQVSADTNDGKFLYRGHLYIRRNGVVYGVLGY